MKIVVIHFGPLHEAILLGSLLIGLQKTHPSAQIIWAGEPSTFDLIKYNKHINNTIDISQDITFGVLSQIYQIEMCINPSLDKRAKEVASIINPKITFGFNKQGPVTKQAQFFERVVSGKVKTNKTILDLYYGLVDMRWKGEGYGLYYYPKSKQTKECGMFAKEQYEDCQKFKLPKKILPKIDNINQYKKIVTDDLFVLHCALALRKEVAFYSKPLPYQIEFFNNGQLKVTD